MVKVLIGFLAIILVVIVLGFTSREKEATADIRARVPMPCRCTTQAVQTAVNTHSIVNCVCPSDIGANHCVIATVNDNIALDCD